MALGIAACVALAALSLLVAPFAPVYDAWAWLAWGRELIGLELDTSAGPSWKPLPVFVTAAAAPAGDAAPELWAVVSRASWLASALLAGRLAARFAGAVGVAGRGYAALAAITAGAGVILMYDGLTPWLEQFTGALSEPVLAALVLGAIDRDLSGHHGQALWLGFAATLIRPEAWPFLAAYALWLRGRDPGTRRLALALVIASPLLWLVPDLIGSGGLFTGAERALAGGSGFADVLGRAIELPPAAMWLAAAVPVAASMRAGDRYIPVLAAGALAWIVVIAAATAFDFAGLARFLVPAGAVVCVLGGAGIAVLARAAGPAPAAEGRPRPAAVVALVAIGALLLVQGGVRAARFPDQIDQAEQLADSIDTSFELVDAVGRKRILACGGQVVTTDLFTQTAVAWKLDAPLRTVRLSRKELPKAGAAFVGPDAEAGIPRQLEVRRPEDLGSRGGWTLYAVGCE
jgi:hypothetical protein